MEKLQEVKRNFDDIASFVKSGDCGSRTVREILANKPAGTWTIRTDASVYEALLAMAEHNVGALVATEGERGVKENLRRKSEAADRMFTELVAHMNDAMRLDRGAKYERAVEVPAWL